MKYSITHEKTIIDKKLNNKFMIYKIKWYNNKPKMIKILI